MTKRTPHQVLVDNHISIPETFILSYSEGKLATKPTQDDYHLHGYTLPADFYATPEGQPAFYTSQWNEAMPDVQLKLPLGQLIR